MLQYGMLNLYWKKLKDKTPSESEFFSESGRRGLLKHSRDA